MSLKMAHWSSSTCSTAFIFAMSERSRKSLNICNCWVCNRKLCFALFSFAVPPVKRFGQLMYLLIVCDIFWFQNVVVVDGQAFFLNKKIMNNINECNVTILRKFIVVVTLATKRRKIQFNVIKNNFFHQRFIRNQNWFDYQK